MLKKMMQWFAIKPEEFVKAVVLGDVKTVKKYLSYHQNDPKAINVRIDGKTPLMQAVIREDLALVQVLLSFPGVDIHAMDAEGNTALSLAAYHGDVEIAELLKNKGSNIHHKNKSQLTAARIARERHHEDCAAFKRRIY